MSGRGRRPAPAGPDPATAGIDLAGSLVALVAAAAGLVVAFLPELRGWWPAGLAACGAAVAVAVTWAALRLFGAERRRRDRLARLALVREVSRVDPVADLRVASRPGAGASMPPYVPRLADAAVRDLVGRGRCVLLIGPSGAGTSRTAYEAVRVAAGRRLLVAPRAATPDAVVQVVDLLRPWDRRRRPVVLWLDDLDRFLLARALPVRLLQRWRDRPGGVAVVATMRESAYHRLVHDRWPSGRSGRPAAAGESARVLEWFDRVALPARLDHAEAEVAARLYPGHDWGRTSLGAALVLRPQLVDRYRTAAGVRPHGVAVVSAAADWRRAGLTRPVRRSELSALYGCMDVPPGTGDGFGAGHAWALERVDDSGARLLHARGEQEGEPAFEADECIVAHRDGQGEPVSERVVRAIVALPGVTASEALQVAFAAELRGAPALALDVYSGVVARWADAADQAEAVAWALCGRASALTALGRAEEALTACGDVVDRFGAAPDAALAHPVAWALVRRGALLGATGRPDDAVAVYRDVEERFGSSPDLALKELVAGARSDRGVALAALGDVDGALAAFRDVIAAAADELELRDHVATALAREAAVRELSGDLQGAAAPYREVVARFAAAPEAHLREHVALARFRTAALLGEAGRLAEAIAAYDDLVARSGDDPEPAVREAVCWALFNRAVGLGRLGRRRDEVAAYDEVIRRAAEPASDPLPGPAACAMVNRAVALGRLGHRDPELAAYEEVERRFGSAADPWSRHAAALAAYDRAVWLGRMRRPAEAAPLYDEVVRRCAGAGGAPDLTDPALLAQLNRGLTVAYARHAAEQARRGA